MVKPNVEILESVLSTMDAARERLNAGIIRLEDNLPVPFAGLMAWEQTAGRGQRGRVWNSRPGESLCATFYFRHGLALPAELGMVALLAGVAVAETISGLASRLPCPAADIGLKWPNDVLLEGRKAGGILIETERTPEGEMVALIGIGLNLGAGSFPPEFASTATALENVGVTVKDLPKLAASLAAALEAEAKLFRQGGQSDLMARWRRWDHTPGRRFHTEHAGAPVSGIAEGIDEGGRLLLRLADKTLLAVGSASTLQEALS